MLRMYKRNNMFTNFSYLDAFGLGTGFRNHFGMQFSTQFGQTISNEFDDCEPGESEDGAAPNTITMVRDEEKIILNKATRATQTRATQTRDTQIMPRLWQCDSESDWEEDSVLVTVKCRVKSLAFTVPITSAAKREIIPLCKNLGSASSVVFNDKSCIVHTDGIATRYDADSEIGSFLHDVCDTYETFDEHMMSEAIGRCIVAVAQFEFI